MKISYPEKKGDAQDLKFDNRFGRYIFSNYNTWHGGIHIEGSDKSVHAIADGRIIGYRFKDFYETLSEEEGENALQYDYSNCFVLVQHDMEVVRSNETHDGDGDKTLQEERKIYTFYSLYNHLMPILEIEQNQKLSFPMFMGEKEVVVSKRDGFVCQKEKRSGLNARLLRNDDEVGSGRKYIKIVVPCGSAVEKVLDPEGNEIIKKNSKGLSYSKVTFTDVDGNYYDNIYICTEPKGKCDRVKDNGDTYEIVIEEDTELWEDKTSIPKEKRNLKGSRVFDQISKGKVIDIIPFGESVTIKETEGEWYKIKGYEGFSRKSDFKIEVKFDENKIIKDIVTACDIPIEAGDLIGYTGKLESSVSPAYRACHLDVFMDEDVDGFLNNDFGAGDADHDYHYATIKKGTVLQKSLKIDVDLRKGLPVKVVEVKGGYAKVQVVQCVRDIPNVQGILFTPNTSVAPWKGYSEKPKGYDIIDLDAVNKYFDNMITADDKTLLWKATINEGLGRTVIFKPKLQGKICWVKLEDLNLVIHEETKRCVFPTVRCLSDYENFYDYLVNPDSIFVFKEGEYVEKKFVEGKVGDITTIKTHLKTAYAFPPEENGIEKLQKDVVVDVKGGRVIKITKNSKEKEYIKVKCSYVMGSKLVTQEGWIENKLETFSAYDWSKFGFKKLEGGNDYLYDLNSEDNNNFLLKYLWRQFDVKRKDGIVNSDELNMVYSILESQQTVSKIVCQHKLEWSYEPDTVVQQVETFFDDQIALKPSDQQGDLESVKNEKLDTIRRQLEKTQFWSELEAATYTPEPTEKDKEYETRKTEINKKYNAVSLDAPADKEANKQAELDALDKEYKKGEYAPKERTVPNADNVYHFHPIAFVKQMMRLETNYDVIFPLDIKPQNDKNNSTYNGKEWYASAESNGTTFGASRDKGARKHAGRDLYASWGTPIRAMADGEVIEMTRNWFNNVGVISIAHKTTSGRKFICRYGEVDGSSIAFKKGQKVMQGDFIARVGFLKYPGKNKDMPPIQSPRGLRTNMLHFEFYSNGETHADIGVNLSSNIYRRKRTDLTDPLEILKEAYENSFEKAQPEKPNRVDIQNLRTSDKGIEFIKLFEGVHKSGGKHVVYEDSKNKATIGYGHLIAHSTISEITDDTSIVLIGITRQEFLNGIDETRATELLCQDLVTAENGVKRHIKVPLSQNEFDALVSLSFNSGADRLGQRKGGGDTQIKTLINKGEYYNGIDEIADITNGNTAGLVKRRQAEMTIFKSNYYAIKIP